MYLKLEFRINFDKVSFGVLSRIFGVGEFKSGFRICKIFELTSRKMFDQEKTKFPKKSKNFRISKNSIGAVRIRINLLLFIII